MEHKKFLRLKTQWAFSRWWVDDGWMDGCLDGCRNEKMDT